MFQRPVISQKTAWIGSILVLFVLASGLIGYQIRTQMSTVPTVSETTLPQVDTTQVPVATLSPEMTTTLSPEVSDTQSDVTDTLSQVEPEPVPMPEVTAPTSVDVASFLAEEHPVVYPLEGEVITVFSVSELLYNETMGDWRIHDGVDIAAPQGTSVVAACAGTVISAQEDDLMGMEVIIDHGNGYQTTYANLQTTLAVESGEIVESGQAIGAVGTTALVDAALAPHLHFSVSYNGDCIDPMAYLNGESVS